MDGFRPFLALHRYHLGPIRETGAGGWKSKCFLSLVQILIGDLSDTMPCRIKTRSLEIHAAEHCNLRCAGCAQNSPFLPQRFPDLEQLGADLDLLTTALHAERLSILGGEPLLNPQISSIVALARHAAIADRVVVTTNGLLLSGQDDAFWRDVDAIEVSVYPATRNQVLKELDRVVERAWEAKTELHLLPSPCFKQVTLTEPIDNSLCDQVFSQCYFKNFCHTLRAGRLYRCGPSTNIPEKLALCHPTADILPDSGFILKASPNLMDDLEAYLCSEIPLPACRFCLGSSGAEVPHRMLACHEVATPARIAFRSDMLGPHREAMR